MRTQHGFAAIIVFLIMGIIALLVSFGVVVNKKLYSEGSLSGIQKSVFNFEETTIAFIKDKNLFVKRGNDIKQLNKDQKVHSFKWSPDGRHILWSQTKEYFDPFSKRNVYLPVSLNLTDVDHNTTKEVIQAHPNMQTYDDIERSNYSGVVHGFDFVAGDGSKIVYTRDGAWLKDLNSGKEEQLSKNYTNREDVLAFLNYIDASWNPKVNEVLFTLQGSHWIQGEVWDLTAKKKEFDFDPSEAVIEWSPDGKGILSCVSSDLAPSRGCTLIDVISREEKELLPHFEKSNVFSSLATDSVAMSSKNDLVVAVRPANFLEILKDEQKTIDLSSENIGIFVVDENKNLKMITKHSHASGLRWLPGKEYVSYLVGEDIWEFYRGSGGTYELWVVSVDGKEKRKLLDGVSAYAWKPVTVND